MEFIPIYQFQFELLPGDYFCKKINGVAEMHQKKKWRRGEKIDRKRVAHVLGIGSIRFSNIKFTQIQKWAQPSPREIVGPCLNSDGMCLDLTKWIGPAAQHTISS